MRGAEVKWLVKKKFWLLFFKPFHHLQSNAGAMTWQAVKRVGPAYSAFQW